MTDYRKVLITLSSVGIGYLALKNLTAYGNGDSGGGGLKKYQIVSLYIQNAKDKYSILNRIDTKLVLGICEVESGFNERARGSAGELGLMQIKTVAAQDVYEKYGIRGGLLTSGDYNIVIGMHYLKILYNRFGADDAVIQAYNVGPTAYSNGKRNFAYLARVRRAASKY